MAVFSLNQEVNAGGAGSGEGNSFSLGQLSLRCSAAGERARRQVNLEAGTAIWPSREEQTVVAMEAVKEAVGVEEMTRQGIKTYPQWGEDMMTHHRQCST